jgi:hypothetical protein
LIFQRLASGTSFAVFPGMIFIAVYSVLSIAVAVSAWGNDGLGGAASVLAIGLMAFFSGAGLRGSFYYGWQQISGAAMAAILCVTTATVIGDDFLAQLFGIELSGSEWAWFGFLAAFICNPGGAGRDRAFTEKHSLITRF